MRISCAAVDDEPLALEKLKLFIGKAPDLDLKGAFTDPLKASLFLKSEKIDLLFLDIQMNEMTGFDIISDLDFKPQIILTTAFDEYAFRAYELSVTDYLLKPFTYERFTKAVGKAGEYIRWKSQSATGRERNPEYIFIKSGYKLVKILVNEILYIEGMRDFQSVVTSGGKIIAGLTFQEFEELLPDTIVRCHKSYMVSLPKIESIEKDRIRIGNTIIPVGEAFRDAFYRKL
jgi:two-component system, LytTR family, response regulator